MSRVETAIHNDVQALKLLRDELNLQAHLLQADTRKQWDELEAKWSVLKEHLGRAEVATDDAKQDVDAAVELLVEALKNGYARIRNALKS